MNSRVSAFVPLGVHQMQPGGMFSSALKRHVAKQMWQLRCLCVKSFPCMKKSNLNSAGVLSNLWKLQLKIFQFVVTVMAIY